MIKKNVVIVRSNLLDRETRCKKIINTLTNNGYFVTFLCWDRDGGDGAGPLFTENYAEIRLRLKAPWGIWSVFYLPLWWLFVFARLISMDWDIAHGVTFDSIPPMVVAGKIRHKPTIYDVLDTYADQMILPVWLRNLIVAIDRLFMRLADCIVLADEAQIEEYGGIPNANVRIIYDSPYDVMGGHASGGKPNDVFTLSYVGNLYRARKLNLDKIIDASRDVENVRLVFAGYGDLVDEIERASRERPGRIAYVGKLEYADALKLSIESDLLFVLRDPVVPVNRYILGSKIMEAMMCGKPILVNRGTSTAAKVREHDCGMVVDAGDVGEIKKAILLLRDDHTLCERLGKNGRAAFERVYSCRIMEEKLLSIYRAMIGPGIRSS